jgi:NAD(P)-dependent dehydrogenase (short-subunit alcohol dehydrogenase family)
MDLELKGKRAVITGGSVGIGLAVAKAFWRATGLGWSARRQSSQAHSA